ncbi:MAG: hypothetical protein M3Y41_10315 [Pseudomonadota bacterium]|nr:hypothetical protein [Pseudomonadota bacterium]
MARLPARPEARPRKPQPDDAAVEGLPAQDDGAEAERFVKLQFASMLAEFDRKLDEYDRVVDDQLARLRQHRAA